MDEHKSSDSGSAAALYGAAYYREQLHHDHWFRDNAAKRLQRWEAVIRMVAPAATDVVVDLGCAAGEHARKIAPHVGKVIGIDSSEEAIALARAAPQGAGNVTFLRGDATALTMIVDASVDKAMAIDFVEHIFDPDLQRMLNEVWRVLKPGGRLALYTPCGTHYVERMKARNFVLRQIPGHVAVRSPRHYDRLLAALPWQAIDCFWLPSTYPVFGLLDRALGHAPGIGPWFQFRFCIVLRKPVAA
jgi:SAM-dependent methyltransferase